MLNAQLPRYVSCNPDPHATFVDAFSIPWTGEYFYAFPPFSLIHKCLKKIEAEQAEGVLVVPAWTTQTWYPQVLQLLTQAPKLMLWTAGVELVVHSSVHKAHTTKGKLKLMSLVRRHYEERGFSEHLTNVLLDSCRPSTQKQYAVYLKKWAVFCCERQITAYSLILMDVLEFLHTQLHLSYSALSCVISSDNVPVGQHPLVCRFVNSYLKV